ncbi:MAG: hypothetical protein A3D92_22110 [Bacteroidetes bacterium RIFCSPHIGHO2_02_FULL_44_7]|nr:MAG: hypothetical protein A3D92_22110 [Bacteroidetes bacterium RIFCSPHIGHO2_02_FULL_44_7]
MPCFLNTLHLHLAHEILVPSSVLTNEGVIRQLGTHNTFYNSLHIQITGPNEVFNLVHVNNVLSDVCLLALLGDQHAFTC